MIRAFSRCWKVPAMAYPRIYADLADSAPHILIAGATGSGKSVIEQGIIYSLLRKSPDAAQFIMIDPKRVELCKYRRLPHVLKYASDPADMVEALQSAVDLMEERYKAMSRKGATLYNGSDIFVVIDELADLMLTARKAVEPLIQRLAQLGRAARVHVIACTQCPLAVVLPTPIKANFDFRIALRTASAQDSRNIIGERGAEHLPRYGDMLLKSPDGIQHYADVPMVAPADMAAVLRHWNRNRRPRWTF